MHPQGWNGKVVKVRGIEPLAARSQTGCSTWLSYTLTKMAGKPGVEPRTARLTAGCSTTLSYMPMGNWLRRLGSNQRPSGYEPAALPLCYPAKAAVFPSCHLAGLFSTAPKGGENPNMRARGTLQLLRGIRCWGTSASCSRCAAPPGGSCAARRPSTPPAVRPERSAGARCAA